MAGRDVILTQRERYETKIKRLLGRRILGIKGQRPHVLNKDGSVLLYKIEKRIDKCNWVMVLGVSRKCKYVTQEMLDENIVWMRFPEYAHGLHYIGDDLWIVDERLMDLKCPALLPCVFLEPKPATVE